MNNSAEQTFQKMTAGIIREYVRSLLYIDDEWPDLAEISEKGEPDESELIPEIDAEDIDVSAGQDGKGMFGEPAFKPEAGTKSGSSISSAGRKDQDFEAKPKKLRATLRGDASLLEFERAVKKEGILFSGITYRKKEHHNLVVDLASRADIVVLDWELASDDGLEAIWILQQLIGMGLRFICIFTQKERLHEIMKHIKKELGVKLPEQREPSGDSAIPEEGPLEFKIENLVIAIRKKRSATSDVNSEFIVEPCTLLDEAIKAMAKVYKGFIQLVMLEITNAHRQYLPNILDRFDPDLDPAFLAEFTDEDSPISRSDAFIGILLDECRAHLKKARSKLLNSDGIKAYSKSFMPNIEELNEPLIRDCLLERLTVQKATANKLVSWATKDCFGEIKNWLESGCPEIAVIQSDDERKRKRNQSAAKWAFISLLSHSELVFDEILKLDVLFHQRSETPDRLTQGTVVQVENDTYYVCVTPACDAERPEKIDSIFSFLLAKPVKEERIAKANQTVPYIVIMKDNNPLILMISLKPYFTFFVEDPVFPPGEALVAYPWHFQYESKSTENLGVELCPIAQLRFDHALALTAAAGADATRVGVDRVEFVRHRLS